MSPLRVEIIAYAPTRFYHCLHCEVVWHQIGAGQKIHAEQDRSGLPDDLRQDYQALVDWLQSLSVLYGPSLELHVIDAASVEGVLKALRYRVRRFPAVIVGGRERIVGGDFAAAEAAIAQAVAALGLAAPGRR